MKVYSKLFICPSKRRLSCSVCLLLLFLCCYNGQGHVNLLADFETFVPCWIKSGFVKLGLKSGFVNFGLKLGISNLLEVLLYL